jgi:ferredoxin
MIKTIIFLIIFTIFISLFIVLLYNFIRFYIKNKKIDYDLVSFSRNEINNVFFDEEMESFKSNKFVSIDIGDSEKINRDFIYDGPSDCNLFDLYCNSELDTKHFCIGFGNCARVCERNAITIENGKAKINEYCNSCGKCISVCPNNLIHFVESKNNNNELGIKNKRYFNFWKKCYKIFYKDN